MDRTRIKHGWLLLIALNAGVPTAWAADPSSVPVAETRLAHTRQLQDRAASEARAVEERQKAIEQEIAAINKQLTELEPQGGGQLTMEESTRRDKLTAQRNARQNELTFLQAALSARRSAIDAQETTIQYLQETELFKRRLAGAQTYFGPMEIAALKAQLEQCRSILSTIEKLDEGRKQRLRKIDELLAGKEAPPDVRLLQAERAAIVAGIDGAMESRESLRAQIDFFQHKLSVASPSTAAVVERSTPTSGPATDAKDAETKQKVAELLEREAGNAGLEAQRQLRDVRRKMAEAAAQGNDSKTLEDDRDYYEHRYNYEKRRIRQADSDKKIAAEKRQIAQLQSSIEVMASTLGKLGEQSKRMTVVERKLLAEDYRNRAKQARSDAQETYERIDREQPGNDIWDALQRSLAAQFDALYERLQRDYYGVKDHYYRMRPLIDAERQQVSALQNSWDVVKLAITNQSTLQNKLASLYERCADQLDPPGPTFWEKNRKIIGSMWIVCVALLASYGLKGAIWLIQQGARICSERGIGHFSVKRADTLLSFFGGIIRLFIWIFAVILVLNEFEIDPARTTGVLGLISLVLAGMFQQIVIDFVKGLDILTGRHYNVGDFVELDGKTGHVIDFSVKHTRIRTASGQEYNLPNSKCVPSRRFPDGYVDNYVDISVRSSGDIQRAKRAIVPVCRHIGRRIEQVKDEPIFVDQFPGTRSSSVILRYRVRVLPGSDWVITDQFIPDVKSVLGDEGIELSEEPTFFFINRIQVFRQLFSRELSENEILQEAKEQQRPTVDREETSEESEAPAPKETSGQPVLAN